MSGDQTATVSTPRTRGPYWGLSCQISRTYVPAMGQNDEFAVESTPRVNDPGVAERAEEKAEDSPRVYVGMSIFLFGAGAVLLTVWWLVREYLRIGFTVVAALGICALVLGLVALVAAIGTAMKRNSGS